MPKQNQAKVRRQGGSALPLVGLGLGAGVLLSYALPTGLLLGLGLMPGLLAWLLDGGTGRKRGRSVLCCNLAGLAPALAELWRGGQGLSASLAMLADWRTLALAWAGAAVGVLLVLLLPLVADLAVDAEVAARRTALEKRRRELREEWGGTSQP